MLFPEEPAYISFFSNDPDETDTNTAPEAVAVILNQAQLPVSVRKYEYGMDE